MASGIQHLALSHPGIQATQQRVTSSYVLAQYQSRYPQIGRSLIQCQQSKMYRYTITPTGYFSPPDAQFDLVHNDIVGPLPTAKDDMHLLTCVHTFALGPTIARHFHRVNRTSLSRVGYLNYSVFLQPSCQIGWGWRAT